MLCLTFLCFKKKLIIWHKFFPLEIARKKTNSNAWCLIIISFWFINCGRHCAVKVAALSVAVMITWFIRTLLLASRGSRKTHFLIMWLYLAIALIISITHCWLLHHNHYHAFQLIRVVTTRVLWSAIDYMVGLCEDSCSSYLNTTATQFFFLEICWSALGYTNVSKINYSLNLY